MITNNIEDVKLKTKIVNIVNKQMIKMIFRWFMWFYTITGIFLKNDKVGKQQFANTHEFCNFDIHKIIFILVKNVYS